MAISLAEQVYQRQVTAAQDDPVGYLIKVSRRVGVGMIVAGAVMGAAGWFLKASATTAMNNELNVVGDIGTIFSNVKAPTFQPAPTGTAPVLTANPIQDVQNFFGDVWSDAQAVSSDIAQIGAAMGTLAEDLAQGIIDVAKAFLAFVTHFPTILWNALVWGVGGSVADILNWLFPYLIVFGLILIGLSLAASLARWVWESTVSTGFRAAMVKFEARVAARGERFFDVVLGNFKHPIAVPVAPTPLEPVERPALKAEAEASTPTPPLSVETPPSSTVAPAAEVSLPEAAGGEERERSPDTAPEAPATPEPLPEAPAQSVQQPEPAPEPPKQTNGTTEQTQQLLGGVPPPGWTEEDVQKYLKEAPPVEEEAPEPLSGPEVSARAEELLA